MQIRGTRSAGPGDDQARFLADLRALRDMAAIGHDELAARAHYPSDILKDAENGPLLPGLPILTAYVRACDGNVPDWEERWRRLTSEIPEDPDLPVRPPGASPAAVAGARAGVGIAPPEVYDPERIKAALRGGLERSGRDGAGTGGGNGRRGAGGRSKSGHGWNTTPGWDTASDETIVVTNGNHTATSWSREPFDAEVTPASAKKADQFRWLPDEEPASPESGTEPAGIGVAETRPADAELADGGLADAGLADGGLADAWAGTWGADYGSAETSIAAADEADPAVSEWATRWDDAAKPAEGTDFWSTSATTPAAELPQPAIAVEEQEYPQNSWSAPAPAEAASPPPPAAAPSQRAAESAVGAEAATPSARFAAAQLLGHQAAAHHKDRLFPARLLLVIVLAALIGSILVLLLK